jgi:hypothetical protein
LDAPGRAGSFIKEAYMNPEYGMHTTTKLDTFPNGYGDNVTWYRVLTENVHNGELVAVIHTKDKKLAIELYGYILRVSGKAEE